MKAFVLGLLVLGAGIPALVGSSSGHALASSRPPAESGKVAATPPASAALRFSLRDSGGAVHTEKAWTSSRAIVMFFITPGCPIGQGYVPEMNRIAQAYAARGVRFYAVQTDVSVADDEVRRHALEFGYQFPVLLDPRQLLVRHTGATVTPEAIVMAPSGNVLYAGRIDNRIASLGTTRVRVTVFDLRNALDAVLEGRRVAVPKATAFGCFISRPS